jgi:hypothetical protein
LRASSQSYCFEQFCNDNVLLFRQKLCDVAGEESVSKLDDEISQEKNALAELIGRPDIHAPLVPSKPSSASTNTTP